jgi:hypothetical protein
LATLFEDFVGELGPDEWLGIGVVVVEVVHDCVLQFGDAGKDAPADAFASFA